MLWELLTERHLFEGSGKETLGQIFFREIPPPSEVVDGVPPDLDAVTMRLLSRDKKVRYATAELAIEDLSACADAPRNGRAEIVWLLSERFPDVRRSRPPPGRASQPPGRLSQPGRASQPPMSKVTLHDKPQHAITTERDVRPPAFAAWPSPSHTTLGGAASQSMAASSRRLRRTVSILAAIFIGVAALSASAIYVTTRRNNVLAPEAVTVQADAPRPIDAPALSQTMLTITTEPAGASVHVDGIDRGASPVTVRVPKGQRVTIDVQRDGYEPTKQVAAMDHDAQAIAITLRLAQIPVTPDAGVAVDAAPAPRLPIKKPSNRGSNDKPPPPPKDPKFNPDDAVGD